MQRGRLEQITSDRILCEKRLDQVRADITELNEVLQVFGQLEQEWHKSFETRLADLVSRGLTLVFQEPLKFVLESKTRGDLSGMEFKLVQMVNGEELTTDILGAKGGGVVAVVGFLLRLLVLLAVRPALNPVLLLDETFAMVSAAYVPNLTDLLRQLVDETGVQIILVTHEPLYGDRADVVYEVTQDNKARSAFRMIKSQQEHLME